MTVKQLVLKTWVTWPWRLKSNKTFPYSLCKTIIISALFVCTSGFFRKWHSEYKVFRRLTYRNTAITCITCWCDSIAITIVAVATILSGSTPLKVLVYTRVLMTSHNPNFFTADSLSFVLEFSHILETKIRMKGNFE